MSRAATSMTMIRSVLRRRATRIARLAALAVLAVVSVVAVTASMGAGGEGDVYRVRAVFKSSNNVTTGADVRVAGANVGSLEKIFVTGEEASIVLKIVDPAFSKFYEDATCKIRLQSLIGEKFVDCEPGTPTKAELREDPTDEGRRLLTSNRTSSPVDVDQLLDAMREPERERFRVIINELGITLTGRGEDLQNIIERFDGTFKEVDDILKILAKENDTLETLAVDGDAALRELSRTREDITGLFKEADTVNRAVNNKREEMAQTLERIPGFLDELEPTAKELETLSNEAAPVARAAAESAKDLSTFVTGTNEFVAAANPALKRLGGSLDVLRSKFPVLMPLAEDLNSFAGNRASVTNIRKLLTSFEKQGGYANLVSMTIGLVGASNGVDSFGHFVRSSLVINGLCSFYSQSTNAGCTADFAEGHSADNRPEGDVRAETSAAARTSKSSGSAKKSSSKSMSSADQAALEYLLGGER
ncbi:MAG: MlaD family protein [Solirubrobacterales bacterium]